MLSARLGCRVFSAIRWSSSRCEESDLVFEDLREIQRQFGYIPAEQLRTLARKIDVPLSRLHSVASFYPHFRLTPPPRVDVRVCQDMSCHLRQACGFRARLDEPFPPADSPH